MQVLAKKLSWGALMLEDMFGLVITPLVDICVSKPTYRTNTPGFIVFHNVQ
jgi:hypothetical protein